MQTLNITLPDPIKQFVDEQVTAGDYSSPSEYLRDLVRAEQKRHAKEQLESLLLSSIHSGDPIDLTAEQIKQTRQRLRHNETQRNSVPQ